MQANRAAGPLVSASSPPVPPSRAAPALRRRVLSTSSGENRSPPARSLRSGSARKCRRAPFHPSGELPFRSGMGLWTLLEGFLLLANALAILNEDRFLAPRGWSMSEVSGNGQTKSLKGQIVGLIYATQFLRVPLIALNVLIIVVKLVSG
ncbi:immediate early response 3-interacting protein 1-like isoform X2 [Panicum virgatum]|uniref:Yos1-like protein n=1 Tax=Panicum virgatum TaxID=38727 RepID=A0A8T0VCC0_PANVG|nr:immediate early response 3-interacting protein 1-like isoform X2 [Panicum virgatum]KAG2631987.1 hypothetical protein PVAP13_2NG117386 [Panicum virgatum]